MFELFVEDFEQMFSVLSLDDDPLEKVWFFLLFDSQPSRTSDLSSNKDLRRNPSFAQVGYLLMALNNSTGLSQFDFSANEVIGNVQSTSRCFGSTGASGSRQGDVEGLTM